jgi:hypothetical protein
LHRPVSSRCRGKEEPERGWRTPPNSRDQAEVAPGIWLPTRYQYDFTARKFLFPFEQHQYVEISQYHRDGSPKQALALVQYELANGKSAYGDP